MLKYVLMLAPVAISLSSCCGTRTEFPEYGSEAGGLKMRLIVNTKRVNNGDRHTVTVEIANSGKNAVELATAWKSELEKGDFPAFVKKTLLFHCRPDGGVPTFGQTSRRTWPRRSPQPTYSLIPGESLKVEYLGRSSIFGNWHNPECHPYYFPYGGQYWVRASVRLKTVEGKKVVLVSNEQLVTIHGEKGHPIPAYAGIVSVDAEKGEVCLSVGALDGVKKHVSYQTVSGMDDAEWWIIQLTEVGLYESKGKLKPFNPPHKPSQLPKAGSSVELEH